MHGKPLTKLFWFPVPEPDTPQPTRGTPYTTQLALAGTWSGEICHSAPFDSAIDSLALRLDGKAQAAIGGSAARPRPSRALHLLPATPTTKSVPLCPATLDGSAWGSRARVLKDMGRGGNHRVAPAAERDRVAPTRRIPRGAWAGRGRSKGSSRCQTIEMLLPAALG